MNRRQSGLRAAGQPLALFEAVLGNVDVSPAVQQPVTSLILLRHGTGQALWSFVYASARNKSEIICGVRSLQVPADGVDVRASPRGVKHHNHIRDDVGAATMIAGLAILRNAEYLRRSRALAKILWLTE